MLSRNDERILNEAAVALGKLALNLVVESASGSAERRSESRQRDASEKRERERGQPVCTRPKEETVFGRVRRKWNGLRENERSDVYMGAIEPVTFIREPVFVHGLFASHRPDLPSPR